MQCTSGCSSPHFQSIAQFIYDHAFHNGCLHHRAASVTGCGHSRRVHLGRWLVRWVSHQGVAQTCIVWASGGVIWQRTNEQHIVRLRFPRKQRRRLESKELCRSFYPVENTTWWFRSGDCKFVWRTVIHGIELHSPLQVIGCTGVITTSHDSIVNTDYRHIAP